MDLDPNNKTPEQNNMGLIAAGIITGLITAAVLTCWRYGVFLLVLACVGCSYARSGSNVAWCLTTGNKVAMATTNGAWVVTTDIAENLTAAAPLVEKGMEGGARGAVEGMTGGPKP